MKPVISPQVEQSKAPKKPRLNRNSVSFNPSQTPKNLPNSTQKPKTEKMKLSDLKKMYIQQLKGISRDVEAETRYRFKNSFLRLEDYSNLESVRRCFDALSFANESSIKSSELVKSIAFVARSSTYDDIHKAMKYGVWSSTLERNRSLDTAFRAAREAGKRVLLFFRSVKDDVFCGVAEVVSGYIEEQKFGLWWEDDKYKGIFNIRWVFVKNVPLTGEMLRRLAMTAKRGEESRNVAALRDGDQLKEGEKVFLLDVFARLAYDYANSVLYYFGTFDRREDGLITSRTFLDFEFKLQKTERRQRESGRGRRKCSFIEGQEGKNKGYKENTRDPSRDKNQEENKGDKSGRKKRGGNRQERREREEERNREFEDFYKDHRYYEQSGRDNERDWPQPEDDVYYYDGGFDYEYYRFDLDEDYDNFYDDGRETQNRRGRRKRSDDYYYGKYFF